MTGTPRTVVIGGGVVGALSAWYLARSGHTVTVIDRGAFGAGCSHGNCGYVCPSHVLPLAVPGAVKAALGAMLRPNSPFSIKLRVSPSLWRWLYRFARRCNERDMLAAGRARYALLSSSKELYRDFIASENIECEWEARGLLYVFDDEREFEHFGETEALVRETFGIGARPYDKRQLTELEPALKPGLGGAWHYEGDCHLRPDRLMSELQTRLESHGVEIVEECEMTRFATEAGRARAVVTSGGEIEADRFVVATGAWTPLLNEHLGCRIPIEPGKGYSLTMPRPEICPRIPMLLESHRVGITPMQSAYRIGSTMEFAGYDTSIDRRRLGLLRAAAEHCLREPYREPIEEEWYGWRPMTWDGLPVIDRSPEMENVWIAAGHNMLGLSMAPATGRLVAELINGEEPHLDPAPYAVARFSRH